LLAKLRTDVAASLKTGADPVSAAFSAITQKQLQDEAKLRIENQALIDKARINTITDANIREREISVSEAKKQYAEELRLAGDNENLQYLAFKKFKSLQLDAETAYLDATRSITEKTVLGLFQNLGAAVQKAFNPDPKAAEDAKKGLEDLATKERELYKARAENSISFEDFQKQIGDLAKQEAELKDKLGETGFNVGKAFVTAFGAAMESVAGVMQQTAATLQAESLKQFSIVAAADKDINKDREARYAEYGVSVGATDEEIVNRRAELTGKDLERYDALNSSIKSSEAQRATAATEATEQATEAYTNMGVSVGLTMAQMALAGKKNIGDFVLVALDGLMSLIPVIVAQIFGQSLAQLGPIGGAVVSGTVTAAFMGLVELAKSAVRSGQGRKTGGYTGDAGVDEVVGYHHGQEFVHTAAVTKRYRPVFEFLHKGGKLEELIMPKIGFDMPPKMFAMGADFQRRITDFQAAQARVDVRVAEIAGNIPLPKTADNSELLRELRETNKRLERIEAAQYESAKEYRSNSAVDVQFRHDETVIVERVKRAALREFMRG
jgi:hypothetical protein